MDKAALEQALHLALELAGRIRGSIAPAAEALLALPGVMRAEAVEPDEADGSREARRPGRGL